MDNLLAQIISATRATVAARRQSLPTAFVERAAAERTPRAAEFRAALSRTGAANVIAECKRRSPLKGLLRADYHPAALARAYEASGAAAVSVLTEPSFFDGALEHLVSVREAVACPVLRKDFVVDEYQLAEARAAGADAVLLIVAVLGRALRRLLTAATDRGLASLVEVHDRDELQVALDAGASIVGVNSRDLRTMDVRPETCVEMGTLIPAAVTAVAESGIRSAAEIVRLRAAGYSAFLIGEQLVRSADPGAALRELTTGSHARSVYGPAGSPWSLEPGA